MSSLRRLLVIVQPVFAALAFIVLGAVLYRQWDALRAHEWQLRPAWLAVSGACIAAGWLVEIRLWERLLHLLGGRLAYWTAVRLWFTSSIVRYLPGNVWQPLGLTLMCRERGIRTEATLASLSLFHIIHVLAVGPIVVVYLAAWGRNGALATRLGSFSRWWSVLAALPVLFLILRPRAMLSIANGVLAKLGRHPLPLRLGTGRLLQLVGISLTGWLFFSGAFTALVAALALQPAIGFDRAAPHLAVAYPIAFAVGFLSLLTPSGLLVREGMLYLLISPVLGGQNAIIVAIAMRAWEVALDALASASAIALTTSGARRATRAGGAGTAGGT